MSQLIGSVASSGPVVDPRIADKIILRATAPLPDVISCALYDVFRAVADQLEKENRIIGGLPVHCFFLGEESFTISLDSPERAICLRLAIYPLPNLAPLIGTDFLYTVLAEELCHLIWDISDEALVNFKVLEVLRNLHPQLSLAALYSESSVEESVQYAHRHPELPLSDLLPSD